MSHFRIFRDVAEAAQRGQRALRAPITREIARRMLTRQREVCSFDYRVPGRDASRNCSFATSWNVSAKVTINPTVANARGTKSSVFLAISEPRCDLSVRVASPTADRFPGSSMVIGILRVLFRGQGLRT
jgi:hypothetical protein